MDFPNIEQQLMIKQYVLLPLILHVFNRDQNIIKTSEIKTKAPYLKMFDDVIKRVEKDMGLNRIALRKNGIKIYEETKTTAGVSLKYKFKGYHHSGLYDWNVISSSVKETMEFYLTRKNLNE